MIQIVRYIIYVKQGVYDESVTVDKKKANLTMVGDGSQKTIVTGNKSHAKKIRTFLTATFGNSSLFNGNFILTVLVSRVYPYKY